MLVFVAEISLCFTFQEQLVIPVGKETQARQEHKGILVRQVRPDVVVGVVLMVIPVLRVVLDHVD